MDFFGIGFGEILLILVVALVIWGPERIVEIGLKLGRIARNLRRATLDLTTQLTRELEAKDKEPPDSAAGEKQSPKQISSTKRET